MRLFKISFIILLSAQILLAQSPVSNNEVRSIRTVNQSVSRILNSSLADTVMLKLELKNANYDLQKGNLPYYLISNKTAYNQTATPTLIVKKTQLVAQNHAESIKKYFFNYLTKEFALIPAASLSSGNNLNTYKIYPLRLNDQNQIEELIEYDFAWQITANGNKQSLISSSSFANNSVLANGKWYKIALEKTGIYKLDKAFLNSLGINMTTLDPKKIRIFGNGGKAVPELNGAFRYDDLTENAIEVIGESDGVFDAADFVLFYGTGVNHWQKTSNAGMKYTRVKNYYSDTSFYYINVDGGAGKRINSQASSSTSNMSTSSYDYFNFYEVDAINFIKSGRQFFGEYFDINTSYNFPFTDGNFITGDSLFAQVSLAGRALTNTLFSISGNGLNSSVATNGVNVNYYLAPYADVQVANLKTLNTNGSDITLNVTKQTGSSLGWMDYVNINARRKLIVNGQFQFRDSRVAAPGNVCDFNISNPSNNSIALWNVTDPLNPVKQAYSSSSGAINFKAPVDSVMEFAIAQGDYYLPVYVGPVNTQNLHSIQQADYVLITHPLFTSYAQRLATLHQQNEGLTYAIVTTEQIYNEFGSGKPEASAIRDFIRMLYTRNVSGGKQPKYVILMGDGSYYNKSRNLSNNSNLIPTYQTANSVALLQSMVTDDFYGLMDPDEGVDAESYGSIDIGIGRLTCRTTAEMSAVVTKIENYYKKDGGFVINDNAIANCAATNETSLGDWRNWLLFMADDGDQATHMSQADNLTNTVKFNNPLFNIDKIYLDAYQRYSTPGGQRYPDASADMNRRIKKGTLLFNYTGHGGEVGLTAERVLDVEMINKWDNFNRLTLFITATCEFTRYDDPGRISAGEYCLLNPRGGAIALLTTCRVAFSSTNFNLNNILFSYMFKKLPNGSKPALGDVIRETKAALTQSLYYSNFHLIGDPALKLVYPEQKVITSHINTNVVSAGSSDTLGALAKITIKGFVADTAGNKLSNFNGLVYPTVFDKEKDETGLLNSSDSYYNSPGLPFLFKLQKNILYRGKAEVKNGEFYFTFMVPKDISFAYGPGKITYYATNGQADAAGFYKKVVVGGGGKNVIPDNEGPQVKLFLNDKNFVSGGTTNEKPVLYANLTDSSGINTLGTGIGHDISVVLDQNTTKPVILNDYYEAALNSYQSGRVRYPFEELSEGSHRLSFKAWDIQNNSNIVNTDFVVASSAELALKHVLNYPNPFTSSTKFFFEHNQACNPLKVTVQIFTISGKIVKTLQRNITCEGFRPEGIDWDGKDDFGDKLARGVYIYKVGILNTENKKAEKTEKLVILN
ncbi:MAG: type IX secretion system sortase PorU [Bacteroidetes bacterium]|nr:type IX secretion system sortase PorU [Bacteroidota bacterium]